MSQELLDLIKQADALTPDEQLQLMAYLIQKLRHCEIKRKSRRKVTEFAGIAPNLLKGMDAQDYVTRMRRGEIPELEIAQVESRKQE
jgi:hypothetical protein